MSPLDQIASTNQRLSLNLAYRLEQEVSIYSDIVLTLRQNLFLRGWEWEHKFACKCALCGAEHDELVDKCETCGSVALLQPDNAQKLLWNHADKTDFFLRANKMGQSFKDVLEDMEFNLDVADRCIALVLKYYGLDEKGEITESVPLEILSLDPRFTKLIYDVQTGLPGGEGKICLLHRHELQGQNQTECKHCGKKLYEVIARTEYPGHNEYYVEGEIFWTSKYFPKFGRPPVFPIIDDAWAYHFLEKRIRNYFEKGRPPAILEVPSTNVSSVSSQMANMTAQLQQNSDYFPWVATDPASHKGLSVVNLMNDPSPEMLEVKADIRLRFGSYFGVMPLFQGDVGGAGGLNNESRQLEVSNRAFTRGQSIYNDKFFPWLMQQFGVTDWKLMLVPAEDADELAEEQIISSQFDNMKKALDMGMVVEYRSGKVSYSGSPQKVQSLMPPLGLDPSNPEQTDTQAAEGPEPMNQGLSFEELSKQYPELAPGKDGMIDLRQKSDCGCLKAKAHQCQPGYHSHDDYEGGKCHPESQVHGGRGAGEQNAPQATGAVKPESDVKGGSEPSRDDFRHYGMINRFNLGQLSPEDVTTLVNGGLLSKDSGRWEVTGKGNDIMKRVEAHYHSGEEEYKRAMEAKESDRKRVAEEIPKQKHKLDFDQNAKRKADYFTGFFEDNLAQSLPYSRIFKSEATGVSVTALPDDVAKERCFPKARFPDQDDRFKGVGGWTDGKFIYLPESALNAYNYQATYAGTKLDKARKNGTDTKEYAEASDIYPKAMALSYNTIYHELAHVTDFIADLDNKEFSETEQVSRFMSKELMDKYYDLRTNKITDLYESYVGGDLKQFYELFGRDANYARTNDDEFFACLFGAYCTKESFRTSDDPKIKEAYSTIKEMFNGWESPLLEHLKDPVAYFKRFDNND